MTTVPAIDRSALRAVGTRIAERICAKAELPISYTNDLALEALLDWSAETGESRWRDQVAKVLQQRGCDAARQPGWRLQPFACLTIAWQAATRDVAWIPGILAESRAMVRDIERDAAGIVLHPRGAQRGGGYAVLIDSGQEYISRCAWAAAQSGERSFADEAARQAVMHSELLRDRDSGMWSQGRGWLSADPQRLSPDTWSRGQGWLMRGLGFAARVLPAGDQRERLRTIVCRLADDLLTRQGPSGLWHAVPNRPLAVSAVETSGSALIAKAFFDLADAGILGATHVAAATRCLAATLPHIDAEGIVHQACYGPGPLEQVEPWLVPGFPPGDHHGVFSVLGLVATALRRA